ncbi:MAG: thermonuclease family protein [Alphaproteobacteria bacterium]|nr:thermonuclease family protein [Alphaproteobacteria bacterium]
MRIYVTFLQVLAVAFFATPLAAPQAMADNMLSRLEVGERATVVEVVDGDTVLLDDGWQVRLVGIQAPKLPLGRKNFQKWPLADESKKALEALVMGRSVVLAYGGQRVDRHGRRLAHLFLDDGSWVQEIMLSKGMARVYSFPDNRAIVAEMLLAEGRARQDGAGIWGNSWYAVRTADSLSRDIGSFQVIEGRIVAAADVRGTVYLNFGTDWRSDFTVKVSKRHRKSFSVGEVDLMALEGRRVRVRGWLDDYNGPMIEATHPEQIEILDN